MHTALFINGVFENTLLEALAAQTVDPSLVLMLQPYSSAKIRLLADLQPSESNPTSLYLSTTTALAQVTFRASIVGWRDKRLLSPPDRTTLNERIAAHQPSEKEVYLQINGKQCVNLIFVARLERLESPVPVSCFIKVTDNTPLRPRSRAGGFAYVYEQPRWLGSLQSVVEEDLSATLRAQVAKATLSSPEERARRLASAPRKPLEVQTVSRAFRRNPDVIVEVLLRAGGRCELCHCPAPFLRLSDGSPYLEVHHRVTLASGGDDTVANAYALCPNCHRREHFGKPQ